MRRCLSSARRSTESTTAARRVLEIKCARVKKDHAEARAGRIPAKYLWQCVHLLLVTGFDHLDYFSFDGQRGVIVRFERDEKLEQKLLAAEAEFWRYVQNDVPPPVPYGAAGKDRKGEEPRARDRRRRRFRCRRGREQHRLFPTRRSR
jgi:predicted phage-related endonuclease